MKRVLESVEKGSFVTLIGAGIGWGGVWGVVADQTMTRTGEFSSALVRRIKAPPMPFRGGETRQKKGRKRQECGVCLAPREDFVLRGRPAGKCVGARRPLRNTEHLDRA